MTGDDENYPLADAMTWAGQHYVPKASRAQLEWDFSDINDFNDTEVYRVPVPTAAEVNEQKMAEALFNATKRAEQAANQQAKLEGALQRIRGICNEVLGHEWYPNFPR